VDRGLKRIGEETKLIECWLGKKERQRAIS